MNAPIKTREDWLTAAVDGFRPMFKTVGYEIPANVRVTLSLIGNARCKTIGRCYSPAASADKTFEILIRINQANPVQVLQILCHELAHATVGLEHKHKGPFVKLIRAMNLGGKPTATVTTPEFEAKIADLLVTLGEFPHAALNPDTLKKQSTRLIKIVCPDGSGYTARITRKWLEEVGAPVCPCCHCHMEEA